MEIINPPISTTFSPFTPKYSMKTRINEHSYVFNVPTSKFLKKRPFPCSLFFSKNRSMQISAHFGRPTRRQNSLREKLLNDQKRLQKNPISLNPSSGENSTYNSVKESDFNSGFVNDVVETSISAEESKLKPLGESVLSTKLENWIDQYKKDVEYWGFGSGHIFEVVKDMEGNVKKVLVNEDEILKRTQGKSHEFDDLSKVNSRILYAKSLAREMESGENVIPSNSSVAKFVVSGKESGFVDVVRGVILRPEFVPKLSRVGRVVICGLVVFWVGRKLISFRKKEVHYTELEKEMMRRKIKSRKEKEMLEKGIVEVVQENTKPEVMTFEKPKINKEELMKNITKAKASEDKLALVNSSSSQASGSKDFDGKTQQIREMARRAREIEAEGLSQVEDNELERRAMDDELSDDVEVVKLKNEDNMSVLSDLSNGDPEQGRDTIETVVTFLDKAKSLNTEFSSKVPSVKKEIEKASSASSVEVSRDCPKINQENETALGVAVTKEKNQSSNTLQSESRIAETNSKKMKPKVIRSVKEAREFLSRKRNNLEFHQPLVKPSPEGANFSTQRSDHLLGVDNVGPTTFGGTSDSKPAGDASESSTWKDKEHVPIKNHDSEYADELKGGVDGQNSPISSYREDVVGSAKTEPSVKMENWIEKNFREIEPMAKKIGEGFRGNFMVAREKVNHQLDTCDDITHLAFGQDDSEFEWMKDDKLREIVFQVRDNELSGRDPFHLMDAEDKRVFFDGLEKKVEKENEKLLQLHEYLHSNIENLDYGADGISVYDPPEKIIPRWKGPPLEKNPEFLDDFLKQRKALFVGNTNSSYPVKKDDENFIQNPTESLTHEQNATSFTSDRLKKNVQDKDPKHSKIVIEGSDGSVRTGKKHGKEFWQHTKKWSHGFLESYNAETDPEVKSIMKDIGKDLDRWITKEEIKESADLMTNLRERNKKFVEKKINKLKREMELFGPQAVVSKYREYADDEEEDYLWWLDLPHVLCIELYTVEEGEQRVGFYSLEMATDLELEPKPHHLIAFEDAGDCKNLCYIIQAHLEILGTGHAFVVPRPPKDAFREAKANGFSVTVIRRGELQLNVDQTLEEVEEQITEIGSKIYHDAIMKERSVDTSSIMKGVLSGGSKPTRRKRAKQKLRRPSKK